MLYINRYKYIKEITNSEFKAVIDNVDLYDICKYIISLDTDTWVHSSYWSRAKAKLFKELEKKKEALKDPHRGEVMWAIYSYLVHNEILMIKNEHSLKGDIRKKDSYYNLLEAPLYHPILTRLIDEGFLIRTYISSVYSFNDGYKIGSSYNRMSNLEKLNIKNMKDNKNNCKVKKSYDIENEIYQRVIYYGFCWRCLCWKVT